MITTWCDGLRLILESEEDFVVVGEAANGAGAVRLCDELHPQVVLMDLRMPGMDGITAIKHIRQQQPDINVVILTTYNEDALMIDGLRSGARSYLLKDTKRQVLFDTLRAASRGESLLSPEVIAKVVGQSGGVTTSASKAAALGEIALTDREQEVLVGVARGERSKEIAARLGITERTSKRTSPASTTNSASIRARQLRWLPTTCCQGFMIHLVQKRDPQPFPGVETPSGHGAAALRFA
jgi:NarL family two-component system response regulator YdfI